jgi:16S rRNA (cytosine1402-N4)-methyltransferase
MGIKQIDGFLFDLGISSHQIDSEHRGFSYMKDASLDMRFNNCDNERMTAEEIINNISEEELSDSLKKYGDIQKHARIAKCIVNERKKKRISTTFDLKKVLSKALPYESYKKLSIVFQVIRILVNNEIEVIKQTLELLLHYLKIGGRIAVISFHSVEDRIIKHFFKDLVIYKDLSYSIASQNLNHKLKIITKKPIIESKSNLYKNPRARSAKLRVAERIK